MDIQKFNPTVAELTNLAELARAVDITDLEAVKKTRLKLRDARTTITKTGKSFREEALAFQKAVIAKEKELLEIITPEEDRLKAVEEEAAKAAELEERKKVLPWRKEQILSIGDGQDNPSEAELLAMDDATFNTYVVNRKAAHLDVIEAEKRETEAAANLEKAKEEAAERARQEERERMEREKAEAEQREKEEQEKAEKNKKYQNFLKKNGYTEETKDQYKVVREGDTFTLFKLVDSIVIK